MMKRSFTETYNSEVKREGERGREGGRGREREEEIKSDSDRDKEWERYREREIDIEREIEIVRETEREREWERERKREREIVTVKSIFTNEDKNSDKIEEQKYWKIFITTLHNWSFFILFISFYYFYFYFYFLLAFFDLFGWKVNSLSSSDVRWPRSRFRGRAKFFTRANVFAYLSVS